MVTFEERPDKMEALDLKLNPEEIEAAVEWQELHEKGIIVANIGS